MSKAHPANTADVSRFLDELFQHDEHATRVRSLATATLDAMTSASLAVHAIGQGLAHARGLMSMEAIEQVDRLLSHQGIDVNRYFEYWVPYIVGEERSIRVSLSWTAFDDDGQETLALSLLTGRGRSMPLLWRTARKEDLEREGLADSERSKMEDALLRRLYDVIPSGEEVTIIADHRSGDCELLVLLERELGFGYVIRIRGDHDVTAADGERRRVKNWAGKGGRAKTLRKARVTDRNVYEIATVICLRDKATKESWCLMASDARATAQDLKKQFARCWSIKTSFHDISGLSFGTDMSELRLSSPGRRDGLLLISVLALALLTLLGATGEALGYDRMLKANTVKHRTHSPSRQGCSLYHWFPLMPEKFFEPLLEAFANNVSQRPALAAVFELPARGADA